MRITLFDRNRDLCMQWSRDFHGIDAVTVAHTDFAGLTPHECIVSPANAFGLMDGGFDLVLRDYFGRGIQQRVQGEIRRLYGGVQPPGTCILVNTGDAKFPVLAHTPTMFYPMPITGTAHVFFAFRSLLHACRQAKISSLACCGLGALTGGMSPGQVSQQMKTAYETQDMDFADWNDVYLIRNRLGLR